MSVKVQEARRDPSDIQIYDWPTKACPRMYLTLVIEVPKLISSDAHVCFMV